MLEILKRMFGGAQSSGIKSRPKPPQLSSVGPEPVKAPMSVGMEVVRLPADPATLTPVVHRPIDDELDDEDDYDVGADEAEDVEGEDLTDPTIGRLEPLQISLPSVGEVELARTQSERVALSGPQKVTPNDPAGPGSLAQTLTRLEAQGLVRSRIVEDESGGFCIHYEPVTPATP